MSKILVIVESPGKIKKIEEYLGNNYIVKASYGHCRDLDSKTLSIDVNDNYKPNYIVIPDKKKVIKDLKYYASAATEVILAADEDREGEMIASSLRDVLKLKQPKRIVFHEITKKAINDAVANPTIINENMVMAQQTRRLLDRLVGYKISPLLWKQMQGQLSAGRVQSVVVRIIVDKEEEIKKSISSPYFKTIGIFDYKEKKLNTVLNKYDQIYKFEEEEVLEFLNKFSKTDICKVVDVGNRLTNRKPSPPFITSTLQQDASTKLGFNSKQTMMIAQKLYEAGMITYMRTDSTNLSKQALDDCKAYIIKNYGDKYSQLRTFTKKSKNAQEAHEAIRPTKLNISTFDKLGNECKRLYSLIWKRTIACQMADAKVDILTIKIDIINKQSILPKDTLFVTNLETIIFDGFLIVYNNSNVEEDTNQEITVEKEKLNIKKGEIINFNSVKVTEEYTKPPLRYNEPGLIKYLEKNGIGRPSTYASIMSKIVDRNYIEISNIDGVTKDSQQFTITKKSLTTKTKVKKTIKEITIGRESKKLVPTEMGIKVNDFMVKNFEPIMDITFTAQLEKMLDKVAVGKAKWYNILDTYYKMFNPMVLELQEQSKHITDLTKNDKLVGIDPTTNQEIYSTVAKYGVCVKTLDDDKWKYAPVKDMEQDDITLEKAIELLEYPKTIGKIGNGDVTLNKGQYGLYFKMGNKKLGIKDNNRELDIEYAKELFNGGDPYAIKSFNLKDKMVHLKKGPYGYYLQIIYNSKKKNKNISLSDKINPDKVTMESIQKSFKV